MSKNVNNEDVVVDKQWVRGNYGFGPKLIELR